MKREIGFYHLKWNGMVTIGVWTGDKWFIIGARTHYKDSDFEEIDEVQITRNK